MTKKTAAQIKRLMKRAEARGETYIPPQAESVANGDGNQEGKNKRDENKASGEPSTGSVADTPLPVETIKLQAFLQYQADLKLLNSDTELKARERRSGKRKADAIAIESSGSATIEELLQWYETFGKQYEAEVEMKKRSEETNSNDKKQKPKSSNSTDVTKKKPIPYILFIGQLSYDTTKEELFQHIQKQLVEEHKVTDQNVQIRMLQDIKTKKSRGMAFVEIKSDDPEFMYSCLKLHRTFLKGRRINVERSAGGGAQTRANKIKQHRIEQEQYIDTTVNAMLEEYYTRGEIQRQGELDDGVIQLCKRHSTTVVQAALERYVESNGREMDNSSAYLSFLLTKLAEEGIYNNRQDKNANDKSTKGNTGQPLKRALSPSGKSHTPDAKRTKTSSSRHDSNYSNKNEAWKGSSEFAKQGIDMSASTGSGGPPSDREKAERLRKVFPTLGRGRGRGRGYL